MIKLFKNIVISKFIDSMISQSFSYIRGIYRLKKTNVWLGQSYDEVDNVMMFKQGNKEFCINVRPYVYETLKKWENR